MIQNSPILNRYILVGGRPSGEYFLVMNSELLTRVATEEYSRERNRRVVAVYRPTGRGPFRGEDGRPAWEFEYQGVRIVE